MSSINYHEESLPIMVGLEPLTLELRDSALMTELIPVSAITVVVRTVQVYCSSVSETENCLCPFALITDYETCCKA